MMKKLSVILLVLLMALGMFAGCVQKANEDWVLPEDQYTDQDEYQLSQDIIYHRDMGDGTTADYNLVQENGNYELYINKARLDIVLIHKRTGEAWFSNPTQQVIDASGKTNEMMSQLQITVVDKTSESQKTLNSYTDCIRKYDEVIKQGSKVMPYYLTYNDDGGLRVKYIMGDFKPDYVVPAVLPMEVFNQMHDLAVQLYSETSSMTEDEKQEYLGDLYGINYMLFDNIFQSITKEHYDSSSISNKEKYTSFAPGIANLESGIEVACQVLDYNQRTGVIIQALFARWFDDHKSEYSQYDNAAALREAWDAEYDVPEKGNNLYIIPLDYILEEDGLKVNINNDGIIFNESKYDITFMDVLKYFGSADQTESGYMFTPDGSGAIINFNNGKVAIPNEMSVQIYGIDRGKDYSTQPAYSEQGYLPVWGIKKQNSTLFSVIEDGEAVASITSDIPRGSKNSVNYTYSSYRMVEYDDMSIFGTNTTLRTYQQQKYSGNITIKYTVLEGDVDYSDMAGYYRNYLISRGLLKGQAIENNNVNFNLELAGAISDTSAFMGIQYDYLNSLTTYKEAQQILSKLVDGGVNGINVRYRGWSNNGLMNQVYDTVRPLGELGGWGDYRELEKYAKENGITLFPECEVVLVYEDKLFDNYMQYLDASRMLSRSNAMYYQYNLMQTSSYMKQAYITKPQKVKSIAESLLKSLNSNKIGAASLGSMGNMLTGDYHVGNIYDRDNVQQIYTDIYKMFSDAGISLATVGGNMYTLAGTDVIYGLPNRSSGNYMADESVPFYQIVVHGYVQYSGEVINQSGESRKSMLKAVESGSGLAYRWMYAPNKDINNVYFEDIYSVNYSAWIDEAIEFYNRYNNELGHTASLTITGHDNISQTLTSTQYSDGTIVYVNYDEVPASVNGHTVPAMDYLVIKGV